MREPGAVGIEALSRGADMVYFVESAPEAAELIRKNLQWTRDNRRIPGSETGCSPGIAGVG